MHDKIIHKDVLVSVIVINYNGKEYIFDCIDSVFKTIEYKFELILIDNDSSDNSSTLCKEKYPEIRLFKNNRNFAMAARNKGIDEAHGDFIVFLDADTVVEPNWLSTLLSSYKKHGDGLYQGKLLKKSDHSIIESCGDMANIFATGFARGRGQSDQNQYDEFQQISFPVGACTFSSKDVFKKIGYVDESHLFFLMLDDLDYGWRAQMLDIPSFYEPRCVIYHVGSPILQWSSRKFFFMERNRWICLLTLYSRNTLIKIFPLLILYDLGIFIFLLTKGVGFAKVKAFFSLVKLLPKIMSRRKQIQKKRLVSDKQIICNFVNFVDVPSSLSNKETNKFLRLSEKLNLLARRLV